MIIYLSTSPSPYLPSLNPPHPHSSPPSLLPTPTLFPPSPLPTFFPPSSLPPSSSSLPCLFLPFHPTPSSLLLIIRKRKTIPELWLISILHTCEYTSQHAMRSVSIHADSEPGVSHSSQHLPSPYYRQHMYSTAHMAITHT